MPLPTTVPSAAVQSTRWYPLQHLASKELAGTVMATAQKKKLPCRKQIRRQIPELQQNLRRQPRQTRRRKKRQRHQHPHPLKVKPRQRVRLLRKRRSLLPQKNPSRNKHCIKIGTYRGRQGTLLILLTCRGRQQSSVDNSCTSFNSVNRITNRRREVIFATNHF